MDNPALKTKTLQARILSGSLVLLSGSGLATAINFAYNIAVARFLGPKGFGNATAVYTLLTLISAVTLSFQLISAKVVAQQKTLEGKNAVYRDLHQGAWVSGLLIAILLLLFERSIADYLNLSSPTLVTLLAAGIAFYVPLGTRRGYVQGAYGFRRLATNLVLEGAVRLCGSLLLIWVGWGVPGVIAANSAAVAVAYLAITPERAEKTQNPVRLSYALRETLQAMVFFSGQMIINNCDIVLVKHFFLSEEAGLYAAVAMVGRVIFAFSQAVVNSMFPLVAGTRDQERKDLKVIATSLLLVLNIGVAIAVVLRVTPAWIWTSFFGAKFAIPGEHGLSYLLALYAITTVVYSLSAVIITYEMSYKIANTSWIQLAFSGVVIAGIARFHSSLREVILVQLILMSILLILVALPFALELLGPAEKAEEDESYRSPTIIRWVSENEVLAEFLKSDFSSAAFREYHDLFRNVVLSPNLNDPNENAKRRALFNLRHLALWSEIPAEAEWCELEIKPENLAQIRVFPRAHWRKLAGGNLYISEVAAAIARPQTTADSRFLSKINEIGDRLVADASGIGPVILIGTSQDRRLTILDGNHRLVAAMLQSPSRVQTLRFFCGFSPKMMDCCWYNTNLMTLFGYARNVLKQTIRRPKNELTHLLQGVDNN